MKVSLDIDRTNNFLKTRSLRWKKNCQKNSKFGLKIAAWLFAVQVQIGLVFSVTQRKFKRRLRKCTKRHENGHTTGFIDTACNNFPVWGGNW